MSGRFSKAVTWALIGALPGIFLLAVAQFAVEGEMQLTLGAPAILLALAGAGLGLVLGLLRERRFGLGGNVRKEGQLEDLHRNKQTVRSFYETAFNDGDPEGAVQRYLGDRYIQHNPQAADGPEAFIGFVKWFRGEFPQLHVEIKRMIAEGDMVVTHGLITTSPEDRGTAAADFFRLENGKIVEHWDVLQPVPEEAANDNTMF